MLFRTPRFLSSWANSTLFPGRKRNARRFSFDKSHFGLAAEMLEDRRLLTTLVVNDDGGGDFVTIREALVAASGGDTILINGGADRIHTEQGISVDENVTIQGAAGATQVIVQAAATPGTATNGVFRITEGTSASIDNLTIRHANSVRLVAGIFNAGTLSLSNSTITQNNQNGIANEGIATVTNSVISQNSDRGISNRGSFTIIDSMISQNMGGGVGTGSINSEMVILNSTITENTSALAAGIVSGGRLTILNSTISYNSSFADGGGISQSGTGLLTVANSTISHNSTGGFGGGIFDSGGPMRIINSTISQNTSNGGGGIVSFGELTAINSTITGNTSNAGPDDLFSGGGIAIFPGESVSLVSTIVAGNVMGSAASDISGVIDIASNTLIGDAKTSGGIVHGQNGNIVGSNGQGTLNINTVLDTTLRDNGGATLTHALVPGSLAVDAGSNPEMLSFDQRGTGFARTFGRQTDIGAFELVSQVLLVDDDGIPGGFTTIQAAIDAALAGDIILVTGGADRIHTEQGITVDENVTIRGASGTTQVIVQAVATLGTATDRVFTVEEDVTAAIGNLTIRHGKSGILNDGTLTITDSTISQNQVSVDAVAAGGIHNRNTLVILNSSITNNTGSLRGGGILNIGFGSAYLEIRNSEISNNHGNGISGSLQLVVSNSTIQNNSGSGIQAGISQVEISNSVISGNQNGFVAGGTNFTISNSTISENQDSGVVYSASILQSMITNTTISGNGTGVLVSNSILAISNSTITTNGSGLVAPTSRLTSVTLASTIVAGNGSNLGSADIPLQNPNLQATNSLIGDANTSGGIIHGQNGNIVGNNGVGTIDINTVLDPILRDNGGPTPTHTLVPGSLAINAGSNPNNLPFDQRGEGFARTQQGQTDIGAVESPFLPRNTPALAFGTGGGIQAQVRVFNAALDEVFRLLPYGDFAGGVRVALGDVTGDGVADVVTAAGAGGGPHVKVFDGRTGLQVAQPVGSFFAYNSGFLGGVYLAVADLNGDGQADIITGAGEGGGPHVRAFSGADGTLLFDFFAYDPRFLGGVRVAAGDITGDDRPDIITGAGPGAAPHVRVFDGAAPQLAAMGVNIAGPLGSFFASDLNDTSGVFVAGNNTGSPDAPLIVTGSGPKIGGSTVGLFRADEVASFQLPQAMGVTVATFDFDQDGINDYLTSTGPGANGQVQLFSGDDRFTPLPFGSTLVSFFPFGEFYRGGIFVAGSR